MALYVSMILGMILGVGISVVNTRFLGPKQYGGLKLLQSIFSFGTTLLTLGLFVSGKRLLALRKNSRIKNELIGALIILAFVISAVLIIALFAFSFFEGNLFHDNFGRIIRIFSPLLFVFPLQYALLNIMQGDNQIYKLSVFRVSPKVFYLLAAIAFNYFVPLTLTAALGMQMVILLFIVGITAVRMKPKFTHVKKNIILVWEENKTFGFQVYLGIIAGVASAQLGNISVGYFIDSKSVGFFSLALAITAPLAIIPNAVGTAFFKEFTEKKIIPSKVTVLTIAVSIAALLFFFFIAKDVVMLLYSKEYTPVISLAYIVAVGFVLHGFGDYLNKFLGAHGLGRELRNGAVVVGISNILGYTLLVYAMGITGAAITRLLSGFLYWLMMFYSYRKYLHSLLIQD
jgi:O-antigen/teichoic acid export membrane protein